MKVMLVFGTRPEAIKMLPIAKEIQKGEVTGFELVTVVTAQHRELLDQVLDFFQVTPDYDLNIMSDAQSLESITSKVLIQLSKVLEMEKPDVVLVHGDTTTCLAASLAAFYKQIPVGHVEAGLRTGDKYSPFPEEMNRKLTDAITDFYFAPTVISKENLLKENCCRENIYVTGNTVVDALQYTVTENYQHPVLSQIAAHKKVILLTMHRRENQGIVMEKMFQMIRQLVMEHKEVELIFPVHPNPKVKKLAEKLLGDMSNIHLTEPFNIADFHNILNRSDLILTDSGGIQEEAPSLNTPVFLLRNETERPEGVAAGVVKLVGIEAEKVKKEIQTFLAKESLANEVARIENPYGDGTASKQILKILKERFA